MLPLKGTLIAVIAVLLRPVCMKRRHFGLDVNRASVISKLNLNFTALCFCGDGIYMAVYFSTSVSEALTSDVLQYTGVNNVGMTCII
jgi:hypothetical protein